MTAKTRSRTLRELKNAQAELARQADRYWPNKVYLEGFRAGLKFAMRVEGVHDALVPAEYKARLEREGNGP